MSTSAISNQPEQPVPISKRTNGLVPQPPKSELDGLIDMLDLPELQQHFMRSRWLEQVKWMEDKAGKAKKSYHNLRLTTIIGGVIVPIIISLNFNNQKANDMARWVAIGLSGVVAISSAVEEFFHYGERWQHYRRTAESLKIQGWQFSQLSGPYTDYESHTKAFSIFANQVEDILKHDVEVYITQVVQEKKEDNQEKSQQEDNPIQE